MNWIYDNIFVTHSDAKVDYNLNYIFLLTASNKIYNEQLIEIQSYKKISTEQCTLYDVSPGNFSLNVS